VSSGPAWFKWVCLPWALSIFISLIHGTRLLFVLSSPPGGTEFVPLSFVPDSGGPPVAQSALRGRAKASCTLTPRHSCWSGNHRRLLPKGEQVATSPLTPPIRLWSVLSSWHRYSRYTILFTSLQSTLTCSQSYKPSLHICIDGVHFGHLDRSDPHCTSWKSGSPPWKGSGTLI
jgi:hypothetical protein